MRLAGRHIDCIRGGREVFSGLDFEALSGEALVVVGPNGIEILTRFPAQELYVTNPY
jgi:ABC-type transport system involved in cytochrome c biogenesis ATPase subunit